MILVPAVKPVTTPVLLIVATVALELVQVPPATEAFRLVDNPLQIVVLPLMVPAEGVAFTVTVVKLLPVQGPEVTV